MGFSDTYTLFSPSGMEVALLAFGASVASIRTADRHGAFANIALALKDPADISCAVEHPLSPCAKDRPPVLYPGETYRRRIVYQFDTV